MTGIQLQSDNSSDQLDQVPPTLPTRPFASNNPFRNAAQHPLSPPPLPPRQPSNKSQNELITPGSSPGPAAAAVTQRAPALPPRRKPVPTASLPSSSIDGTIKEDDVGVEDDMTDVVTLVDQRGVHPSVLPRRRPVPTSSFQAEPIRSGESPDLIESYEGENQKEEEAPPLPARPAAAVRKSVFLEELGLMDQLRESPVTPTTPESRLLNELDTFVESERQEVAIEDEEDLYPRAPSEISRTDTFSSDTTTLIARDLLEQNASIDIDPENHQYEDYEAIALAQFPTNSDTASTLSTTDTSTPVLPIRPTPNAAPSSPSLSLRTLMTQARSNPAQLRHTLRTHRTELEERVRRGLESAAAKAGSRKPVVVGRLLSRSRGNSNSDVAGEVQGQEGAGSVGRYEDVRARVQARNMPAPAAAPAPALVPTHAATAAGVEGAGVETVVVAAEGPGVETTVSASASASGLPVRHLSDSGAGAGGYTARVTVTNPTATLNPTPTRLPPPIRLHTPHAHAPAPGAFPAAPPVEPTPHPAVNILSALLHEPPSVTYARLALLRNAADSLPMLASLPKPSRQTLIRCGLGALEARLGDNPRREVGVFATALGAGACVCEGWVGVGLLVLGVGCSMPEMYIYWAVGVVPIVLLAGGWMKVVLGTAVVMWNVAGLTSNASRAGDGLGTGSWGAGQGQDVAGWGTPAAVVATGVSTPGALASGSRTPGPVPPTTMANREVGWKHFALEGVGWLKFRTSESERARRADSKARKDLAKAEKKRAKEEKAKEREEERKAQEAKKAKEREEERKAQEEKMRVAREVREAREREKALKKVKAVKEDVTVETEAQGVGTVATPVTISSESTPTSSVDGTLPVGTGVLPVGEGTLPVGAGTL
ncbi:hypothetical protein YB2330_005115 [Saitoella coloradoensis]